jgi:hypothetical protein
VLSGDNRSVISYLLICLSHVPSDIAAHAVIPYKRLLVTQKFTNCLQ